MLKTVLLAFAIPVILTATTSGAQAVTATHTNPEPIAYDYPSCHEDPDVSCVTRPGDPESAPTYESGHYPEGWAAQHYRQKGQNEYGQPLAVGQPVSVTPVAETVAETTSPPVQDQPTKAAMVAGASTEQPIISDGDWLYDALYELLYKD